LDDIGPEHIGVSPTVRRYPELDGANVPHGLGVRLGILLACFWLFSWSKKPGVKKKLASPKILRGNTWNMYCVRPIAAITNKKSTINHGMPPGPRMGRPAMGQGNGSGDDVDDGLATSSTTAMDVDDKGGDIRPRPSPDNGVDSDEWWGDEVYIVHGGPRRRRSGDIVETTIRVHDDEDRPRARASSASSPPLGLRRLHVVVVFGRGRCQPRARYAIPPPF